MPYSLIQRCVFIHVPKVVGTAIIKALGIDQELINGKSQRGMIGHMKWQDYIWLSGFFSFSFVRHPVSRFITNYYYAW